MGEFGGGGGKGNKCCVSAISNYVVLIFLFITPNKYSNTFAALTAQPVQVGGTPKTFRA